MRPIILMVEDDSNMTEALKEYFEEASLLEEMDFRAVRTVKEANIWVKAGSNFENMRGCILDLMFPPEEGDITGTYLDFAQGLGFYQDVLQGKCKTLILTGATRWTKADEQISGVIANDKDTIIQKKPMEPERIESIIRSWLSFKK